MDRYCFLIMAESSTPDVQRAAAEMTDDCKDAEMKDVHEAEVAKKHDVELMAPGDIEAEMVEFPPEEQYEIVELESSSVAPEEREMAAEVAERAHHDEEVANVALAGAPLILSFVRTAPRRPCRASWSHGDDATPPNSKPRLTRVSRPHVCPRGLRLKSSAQGR